MDYWKTIYKYSGILLAFLIIIGIICVFAPKCHRITELQKTKASFEQKNGATEREILEIKSKRDRFTSDPAFVERTARDIGMIKPDEIMYKFTNSNGQQE